MSLLSGMDQFGLGHLSSIETDKELIDNEAKKLGLKNPGDKKEVHEETEIDFIFQKEFECPVCGRKFKQLVVKTSKARPVSTDKDLKANYNIIDPLKYDVIHCNNCGYAVLQRYYGHLPKPHKDLLIKTIANHYKPSLENGSTISYSQAFKKYKLALVNAMCRQAKDSEIALIYLKMGWLLRNMLSHEDELSANKSEFEHDNLAAMEEESIRNAMDGFIKARLTENPPIAGMSEVTLEYLIAVLSIRFGNYDSALKMIQSILVSKQANFSQKDKALELKEEIKNLKKEVDE